MWAITDTQGRTTTIAALREQHPELVAYDESGWYVHPDDLADEADAAEAESLADSGYYGRAHRRILIWASEAESLDDSGEHAIAIAEWQ